MTTTLVTGANRGIGLELCRQLRARGDQVLAVCRKSSPELERLGARVLSDVDVASDSSVKALAARLGDETIDVLVHNAGIMEISALESMDFDAMRRMYEVNSIGPLRVTAALLPRLKRGSKIAIVSSRAGSIGDNTSGGMYGYRMSKAAVNMAGVSLARDLRDRGIAVAVLHPGFIRTELTGGNGNDDPPVAARGLIERIDALSLENTGEFRHANGTPLPW